MIEAVPTTVIEDVPTTVTEALEVTEFRDRMLSCAEVQPSEKLSNPEPFGKLRTGSIEGWAMQKRIDKINSLDIIKSYVHE